MVLHQTSHERNKSWSGIYEKNLIFLTTGSNKYLLVVCKAAHPFSFLHLTLCFSKFFTFYKLCYKLCKYILGYSEKQSCCTQSVWNCHFSFFVYSQNNVFINERNTWLLCDSFIFLVKTEKIIFLKNQANISS